MSLRGPSEVFVSQVLPRLLAAPAELILDALPPLQPQFRFLEVGAGGAVVAKALVERIAGLGRLIAIDDDAALAISLPAGPKRAARAVAGFPSLPFQNACFDVAIANLVLGDGSKDAPRLAELKRVLRPGGWLLATVALSGSFRELLALLQDGCEGQQQQQAFASASSLPSDDVLRGRFVEAGFTVPQLGVEERLLATLESTDLAGDALVKDVLIPALTGAVLREETLAVLEQLVDARHGGVLPVQLRTAIVTARLQKT